MVSHEEEFGEAGLFSKERVEKVRSHVGGRELKARLWPSWQATLVPSTARDATVLGMSCWIYDPGLCRCNKLQGYYLDGFDHASSVANAPTTYQYSYIKGS
jgi:hypothetical protein